MSIERVEIESIHGDGGLDGLRMIYYRCIADDGCVALYGPVITSDPAFDGSAYCEMLRAKLNERDLAR
jgi:hypothetical protein